VLLVLGAALGAWLQMRDGIPVEPEAIRARILALGPLAPLVFVGIVALRPLLLLPSGALMVAAGLIFGVLAGTVWATLGVVLGALIAFGAARLLGREAVERRMGDAGARADAWLARRGWPWLAGYSALPFTPLTGVYALLGLSSMATLPFVGGVAAGLLPRSALYAFFGATLLEGSWTKLALATGLLGLALLVGLWARHRMRSRMPGDAAPARTPQRPSSGDGTASSSPERGPSR
jgi:uncharacterized membrane protein YdjX (TVP38/TMEM64 family)